MKSLLDLASIGILFAVLAFWMLIACGAIEQEAKGIGADLAEVSYCEIETCGEVFLCTLRDGSSAEWCWVDGNAEALREESGAVSCVPTPRGGALGWPCLWHCDGGRGCNATGGCFGCGGR